MTEKINKTEVTVEITLTLGELAAISIALLSASHELLTQKEAGTLPSELLGEVEKFLAFSLRMAELEKSIHATIETPPDAPSIYVEVPQARPH